MKGLSKQLGSYTKRFLAAFLAVAMVVVGLPAFATPVYAGAGDVAFEGSGTGATYAFDPVSIAGASSSSTSTITVTPAAGYYISDENLTAIKNDLETDGKASVGSWGAVSSTDGSRSATITVTDAGVTAAESAGTTISTNEDLTEAPQTLKGVSADNKVQVAGNANPAAEEDSKVISSPKTSIILV